MSSGSGDEFHSAEEDEEGLGEGQGGVGNISEGVRAVHLSEGSAAGVGGGTGTHDSGTKAASAGGCSSHEKASSGGREGNGDTIEGETDSRNSSNAGDVTKEEEVVELTEEEVEVMFV